MGLVDKIKQDVKKSGQSRGKFTFIKEGQKTRVRFLTDLDDGIEVAFHDSFEQSVNVPCQELFGRPCEYCEDDSLRTRSMYIWSVWNYEAKEVQLFMFAVNRCSPVPPLLAMYDNYGTLTDRDYVLSVSGKQMDKTYTVVPQDKAKFRNTKAKPYSESAILDMLDKAYPCDSSDDEDDEPKKRPSKVKTIDNDDDDWGDEESEEQDYSELTPKELYQLCKERSLDAQPKKPAKYYINLLEEDDEAHDEWDDDEDEEDDWDDE